MNLKKWARVHEKIYSDYWESNSQHTSMYNCSAVWQNFYDKKYLKTSWFSTLFSEGWM